MAKWRYLAVVVPLAALGGYLAAGYGSSDERAEWWRQRHLDVLQEQLGALKRHLRDYREAQGRYPSNDEGLAALDDFEARTTIYLYRRKEHHNWLRGPMSGGREGLWFARRAVGDLCRRMQTSDSEDARKMLEAFTGASTVPLEQSRLAELEGEEVAVELAVGHGDELFVLSRAGVLSPWLIPYVYDNRTGAPASAFAGSPADDGDERYSVEVAAGVYVWSVGRRMYAEEIRALWWERNWPRFVGAGMLLAAGVLLAVMLLPSNSGRAVGLVAALGSGAGGFLCGSLRVSCYIMAPMFSRRDPKMVARRRNLLEKHRGRGVISEATYRKAVSALERSPATQPTTAPRRPAP
jgi:hypothetical protein